jgi:hypothetical protein
MLLCWIACVPPALAAALDWQLHHKRPPQQLQVLLAAAVAGSGEAGPRSAAARGVIAFQGRPFVPSCRHVQMANCLICCAAPCTAAGEPTNHSPHNCRSAPNQPRRNHQGPSKPTLRPLRPATVLEFLTDHHRGLAPLLALLLWSAAKAAEFAWRLLRVDATAGGRITGGGGRPAVAAAAWRVSRRGWDLRGGANAAG